MSAAAKPDAAVEASPRFGSDCIADLLRALDIEYIALTPGASFRGLHDSLVNYLGNQRPELLLCLGHGPIRSVEALEHTLGLAIGQVRAGSTCVIDVRVAPEYARAVSSALLRNIPNDR